MTKDGSPVAQRRSSLAKSFQMILQNLRCPKTKYKEPERFNIKKLTHISKNI